jgi:hypothetical protein
MGWINEMPVYGLSFPLYVVGLLVVPERDEAAVPEVSVLGPFDKFKLSDELRFQPQYRMPDYAVFIWGNPILEASARSCASMALILIRHSPRVKGCAETTATDRPA